MKILVPIGCRSDEGLVVPVVKRLQSDPLFQVQILRLVPPDFSESYTVTAEAIARDVPDLALINADRVEMCAAAAAAFHLRIPIAHMYAGIGNNVATFDDIDRHCITLWSEIQFCESVRAAKRVCDLKASVGLKANAHAVGITHLDDLEVDESTVPEEPYDLVLYNVPSISPSDEQELLSSIQGNKYIIQIGGNPDGYFKLTRADAYYQTLPRSKFFGLLKNCQRFITNSSAALYEAPHFLLPEQIIMIGDRNRGRDRGPFEIGASERIIRVLEEYAMGKAGN